MESFFGHFHLSILYPIQVYKNKNLHVYVYYNIPAIKIMGWGKPIQSISTDMFQIINISSLYMYMYI